jgi:endoglycosylceramidase
MVRRASLVAAVLVGLIALSQPAIAAPAGTLRHAGRWLIDDQRRVVVLHGLGVMDYSPPSLPAAVGFGDDDAAFLAAHGFNYVRVGMNWSGIEPRPGVFDAAYARSITETVRTLAAHHIYSLLDWHQDDWGPAAAGIDGAPPWATETDGLPNLTSQFAAGYLLDPGQQHAFDNFWRNAQGPGGIGLEARYAAMLAIYGSAFRRQPYLLGYELFNEPFPGTPWPSCANPVGCPVFDQTLSAFYRRTIRALRAADRSHLIFYEPNIFFDFGANTNLRDASAGDDRTAFAFHDYCLGTGAGSALPPVPGSGPGCSVEEQLVMNEAASYASRTGAALINSEWGATADPTVLSRMTAEFDQARVSWLYWAYNGADFVPDPRKPPTGSNINGHVLDLLDRPYPQAVAGTPVSWSWDPSGRVFRLRYRIGSGPVRRELTVVWIGALHFPNGYRVHVNGANAVSRRDAPQLLLRAANGASSVEVTVTAR